MSNDFGTTNGNAKAVRNKSRKTDNRVGRGINAYFSIKISSKVSLNIFSSIYIYISSLKIHTSTPVNARTAIRIVKSRSLDTRIATRFDTCAGRLKWNISARWIRSGLTLSYHGCKRKLAIHIRRYWYTME